VGGLVGPTESFLVPRELLRRRSRTFRDLLERQAGELSSKVIPLPNTPAQTIEDFFVWTLSPQPQIDERATFSEVVRLGIFAWLYQISALSNQVTDVIRSNLANGHWQLQASMMDDIYEAVPAGSPVREVIRAALGQLPRLSEYDEGRVREEWKATFLKHAQLGWDYYEAGGSAWTSQDYLSGACRFHDHQEVSHQEELIVFGNQCAYAREECFPRWEEESMKSQKDEVDSKEQRVVVQERNGEQEECGADEERKERELSVEAVVDEAKEPVATEAIEATEAVVDGVAAEAEADGVATEAEVDGVATEVAVDGVATEAEVDGVATEVAVDGVATEAAVNGVATKAVVDGVATEAVANDVATEAETDGVATEAAVNSAATEAEVDGVATKAVVDGVATEAMANGVVTEPAEAVVDDGATEPSVVDVAEGPVALVKTDSKNGTKKKKKKKVNK
jgi:hypothetical protein